MGGRECVHRAARNGKVCSACGLKLRGQLLRDARLHRAYQEEQQQQLKARSAASIMRISADVQREAAPILEAGQELFEDPRRRIGIGPDSDALLAGTTEDPGRPPPAFVISRTPSVVITRTHAPRSGRRLSTRALLANLGLLSLCLGGLGGFRSPSCWLLFVLFSVSCFNPDLSQVTYRCDPATPKCPETFECRAGVCVDPATPQPDGASQQLADLSAPPDSLPRAAGCTSGAGYELDVLTFACPGKFVQGGASSLCAQGFAPCSLIRTAAASLCARLPGFFSSTVEASGSTATKGACGAPRTNAVLMVGCGSPKAPNPLNPVRLFDTAACPNLDLGVDCAAAGDAWSCGPDATKLGLAWASSDWPDNGILCCK